MIDIPRPDKDKNAAQPRPSLFTPPVFMLLAVVAGLSFVAGVWFANTTDSPHNNDDFQVFWDSWDILEREYYYDLPEDTELIHAALRGMFASTGNRYTFFSPPAVARMDRERTAGEFGGIGAYVSQDEEGQLIIARPFNGLPAAEAGLQTNDVILAVNGTSIQGWTFEDAIELLRGDIGSKVTLTIYRLTTDTQFDVEITRARVEMPVTSTALYGDVGYVALASFNQKATESLEEDIRGLQELGIKALILDLRGNPGGLLDQAVAVSDLFLGEGVVVSQQDRSGKRSAYHANDGDLAEEIPLVVLIDGGSASASEVVAGALRDYHRAMLIGQTSFGKGSVQHVYDMDDGSQVHVTFSVWLTPDNILIDGQGLTPDITVDTTGNTGTAQDPYIAAALAYFQDADLAAGE